MLQKSQGQQPRNVKKTLVNNGSFQLPTSLNWFALIPDVFFEKTSTSVSRRCHASRLSPEAAAESRASDFRLALAKKLLFFKGAKTYLP